MVAANGVTPMLSVGYLQQYSSFYYLNSSSVAQTDALLREYGRTSVSGWLGGGEKEEQGEEEQDRLGRRLDYDGHSQTDESLFMRG